MFSLFQREGDSLLRDRNNDNTYEIPARTTDCSALPCPEQAAEENEYETIGFKPATWEVPKRSLTMSKDLGSGHFGKVVKGTLKTKTGVKDVAVKMLKGIHQSGMLMVFINRECLWYSSIRNAYGIHQSGMLMVFINRECLWWSDS